MFNVGDKVRLKDSVTYYDYKYMGIYDREVFEIDKISIGTISRMTEESACVKFPDGRSGWYIRLDFLNKVNDPLRNFIRSLYV